MVGEDVSLVITILFTAKIILSGGISGDEDFSARIVIRTQSKIASGCSSSSDDNHHQIRTH